ncbi:Uncharacterised protein [uncultured archaeon]|nr:Uncharacterised protein [uncultured archaeon]
MEEITLVFSSLAGACTAVALDKIPRRKHRKQTMNSAIDDQLHTLRIEREILAKTISRLQQQDSNLTKIQRDKLLIRYQHQIGIIIAKTEKLETISRYPDLGAIGDSLITLMDSKLSNLDQKLHEISSKISVGMVQSATQPIGLDQSTQSVKQQDRPKQVVQERPRIEKIETKTEVQDEALIHKEKIQRPMQPIEISIPERHRAVELSTLTEIPSKMPEFPAEFIKPSQNQVEPTKNVAESAKELIEIPQQVVSAEPAPQVPREASVSIELPNPTAEQVEKKIQLPTPIKIPEEEKIEDDDKDLDKIKSEIMKALSKLEQVEVE